MSAKLFTTEEQLVSMVTEGLRARLGANISERLHAIIDPEIAAVAKQTAEEVTSKVVSFNDTLKDKVLLTVIFNERGKK